MKIANFCAALFLVTQSLVSLASAPLVCRGAGLVATFSDLGGVGASVSVKVADSDELHAGRCTFSGGSDGIYACSAMTTSESGFDFVVSHFGSPDLEVTSQAWDMSSEGEKTLLYCE